MPIWDDVIDPATLTGFVRGALEERERAKGSLSRFLPSLEVPDISVRFERGQNGLIPEANFRAYDAEIETGSDEGQELIKIDLPPLGRNIPVTEYHQLRMRAAGNAALEKAILRTAARAAASISARIERMRGAVLVSGKAVIDQPNFKSTDDFQRDSRLTVTASTRWGEASAKVLEDIESWVDIYRDINGMRPERMLVSPKVARAMRRHKDFATLMPGGGTRAATMDDLRAIFDSNELPMIEVFDRKTAGGMVLPENKVLFLPEPVDPYLEEENPLGNVFWGQTLSSMESAYGIDEAEQPGVVAAVYRGEKPPHIAEVIADAIALPVLANANLSMCAEVLS